MSDKSVVEDLNRISASTGFSWLNAIPVHWRLQQLRYLADIRFSNVDKKSDENELLVKLCNYTDVYYNRLITSQIDFMEATATQEEIEKFGLRAGDVLVTKDSESWNDIAIPAYVPETLPDVICGYHLALIRPDDIQLGRYLAWAFASSAIAYQFNIAASGITRYGLSQQAIKDAWFPIPPLLEQRAIADFLDRETAKIDALIARKQRLLELLAERRQALITHAVTKGLDPDAPMKDSGIEWLGEIPYIWMVMRLRHLISGIDTGFSPQAYNYPAQYGEWGVLKTGCVNGGIFNPNENKALPEEIDPPLDIEVIKGDVLMSRASGSMELIGSVAMVEAQPSVRLLLSDKTFRLRLNTAMCDKQFFVAVMGSYILRQQIRQAISGAEGLANNIAQSNVRELLLPVPPLEEQLRIMDYLSEKIAKLDRLAHRIRTIIDRLQERRAVLINDAVTGKMKVTG